MVNEDKQRSRETKIIIDSTCFGCKRVTFSVITIIFFSLLHLTVERQSDKLASDMKMQMKQRFSTGFLYMKKLHQLMLIEA